MKYEKYIPLDVILELPSTRLLRAMRRFDWASPSELMFAAGFPDYIDRDGNNSERNAAAAALSRLVAIGHAERRSDRQVDGYPHRITAAGRRELERREAGVYVRGGRRQRRAA